ncbi:hypothetical protein TMatcc_009853 [Talaromyces marneffei ATCC 18224]|uniref:Uncharacterized protein n=2 Tax=Talaromyces marneffei TaxID=37727 RepID=B6QTI3_TALMQ|nr:uncharacterized protein EYB26_009078 [Talaromyces marneffei]EEA19705.1 hypothetical protein PMAA_004840 [Talaromyces marneffei ATCC 18224]KAE8548015.1 hypothetical protein EYB25_009808 [Talaromyces marneffei]QGA21368.1 hypothetical protein EYB26_009078 [Talaromyces marneffei]
MACFILLRDNVPAWISEVNQLSAHIHIKRAEFAAEADKLNGAPSSLRRKKSISSSFTSVSSRRGVRPTTQGLKRLLSRESLNNNDGVKKQRTVKDDEYAPTARRRKPAQVISYDGHTQKTLEKMVRDIWTAKSSIRSSRISSSMRTTFGGRMKMHIPVKKPHETGIPDITSDAKATIEVDPDAATATDNDDGLEDQLELRMFMMKQRSRRNQPAYIPQPPQLRQSQEPPSRTKESPFDFIECQLENAQNLCETAAYKFLREGNCLDELDRIKQAYELILEASTTMAEQEEEKAKAEQEQQEDDATPSDAAIAADELETPVTSVALASKDAGDNGPEEMNVGLLEVDDQSDTSEVSIDISAFRMTRYGQRTMHPFKVNHAQ